MKKKNETKIGLSTSCLFPLSLRTTFRAAKNLGYDGVEVMVTADKKTRDINYLKQLEETYEVPILSIHAPTLLASHFVWGVDARQKLIKTIELTEDLGANTIVVHPPFFYQRSYVKIFIQTVKDLEEEFGVTIAVENMFPWTFKGRSKEIYLPSWETITEEVNSLTLDFSHAALSKIDTLDLVKKHHEKIKHIHLCDGFGFKKKRRSDIMLDKLFDEHLLPGEGSQPIAEVFQILKDKNWEGQVVAEVRTSPKSKLKKRLQKLDQTLTFAKEHLS